MKKRKILVLSIIVFSMLLSSFLFYGYQILSTPNVRVEKTDKLLYIHAGTTYKELQKKLVNENYVNDLISFSFLAKLMKYQENVKPGRYLMKSNMTNREAIGMLRRGEQVPVKLTFNNARTLSILAGKIAEPLAIDSVALSNYLMRKDVQESFDFNQETFIGMFLPNTYEVYWTISPEALVKRLYDAHQRFWNEERKEKAASLNMSTNEVTTLASIVEAETQMADESPLIAGLYINRLKKGMPLQADPTLIFAHQDYTIRRVLNKHKTIDSPYNTYLFTGLPPGPINMPSIRSIEAVLNYEKHNYLYFCAKEDFSGYHNFAKSLSRHMENARKYQKALNRAGIYN